MKLTTVYNPQKGRLESIAVEFTYKNTTWFDNCENSSDVLMITDFTGGLIIKENNYNYPIWIYEVSRKAIGFSQQKASKLLKPYI